MKVLTRKDQAAMAHSLAIIYHCYRSLAEYLDLTDEDELGYIELMAMALANAAHIAGGLKMMRIIPELGDRMRSETEQEETEGEE